MVCVRWDTCGAKKLEVKGCMLLVINAAEHRGEQRPQQGLVQGTVCPSWRRDSVLDTYNNCMRPGTCHSSAALQPQ